MMRSQNFRQCCYFIEVNKYMSPSGTDPKYNDRPVICNIPYDQLTKQLQEQIEGFNKRYDQPLTNIIIPQIRKVEKPTLFMSNEELKCAIAMDKDILFKKNEQRKNLDYIKMRFGFDDQPTEKEKDDGDISENEKVDLMDPPHRRGEDRE